MEVLYRDMKTNTVCVESKIEGLIRASERLDLVTEYVKKSTYLEREILLTLLEGKKEGGEDE